MLFVFESFSQRGDRLYLNNDTNCRVPIADSMPINCIVKKIKKIKNAYVIDVLTDDDKYTDYGHICGDFTRKSKYITYTILSLKTEKQDLEKIKVGKRYKLILLSYYDYVLIGNYDGYRKYVVDDVPVIIKESANTGRIATTPCLSGLYYISPEN